MRKIVIFCIVAFVVVGFVMILLYTRLYMPCNIAYGIIHQGANDYMLPEDALDSLLAHFRMTFTFKDSPSCGFDESYMITLWDAKHQLVSKLLIAQDGCGTFQIGNTRYYLEGKEDARKIIDSLFPPLELSSADD